MSKIKEIAARLRSLTPEVMREETLRILKDNETIATNMNTDQLFAGKLASGQDMPDYSETSIEKFGKRPGPYQLYETGEFYRKFYLNTTKFPVTIFSEDNKTPRIMELIESKGQNPDDIFGLNKINFKELARVYTLPELQALLRKTIKLR